jgi:predicted DNA-binding transcriptional regulator AlpA
LAAEWPGGVLCNGVDSTLKRQEKTMERAESDEDLLLLSEVSELTRLPEDTIRYLRHKGTGPPGFLLGRRVMFRRGAVKAWIKQREEANAR